MVQLFTLFVMVAASTLQASAAPQYYPDAQTSYDAMRIYQTSTPGYWQTRGMQTSIQRDNSMVSITTDKPQTPLGFIPSLDDAKQTFTGQIEKLPYPNFQGFPLYPFTPYAQGMWW